MIKKLLPDICKIQYGYAFDSALFTNDKGLPLVRIRDITRGYSETYTSETYTDEYLVANNDILIGMDGEFNIARWNGGKALLNQRVCKLIPSDMVDANYLFYFMPKALKAIEDKTPFVTVKHLSAKELNRIEICLPNIETQRKIATILENITTLISLRKQQLAKLDELVKARFVEMFGDPRTNSKGFKTKKGIDLFKISNGKAVPNDKRFDNGVPAYGGNGISWYTDDVLYEQDTIVIGRVGFQSGNVHLVKGPVWITDNAMYISEFYDDSLSLVFLCEMMEQIDFTKCQDAGDLKKVTQKPFMEMEYILPSKNLQSDYIAFVEQTDKSKSAIQQSLDKLETLKKALMQKYFG